VLYPEHYQRVLQQKVAVRMFYQEKQYLFQQQTAARLSIRQQYITKLKYPLMN